MEEEMRHLPNMVAGMCAYCVNQLGDGCPEYRMRWEYAKAHPDEQVGCMAREYAD